MDIIKSSFSPAKSLKGKSNYKPYYRIERDGSVFERILLDIEEPSIREEIICLHYFKNYVKVFFREQIGFNIISRDDPWDFKVELSTKEVFNVEITSIADNQALFEKVKREERLITKSYQDIIPFHELRKLNSFFPNSEIDEIIRAHEVSTVSNNEMVNNPYKKLNSQLFLSNVQPEVVPMRILLEEAIVKKHSKKHSHKENTVLIVDNRTLVYEISDLHEASRDLQNFYSSNPFREIWFYTGYCSDLDGNNAEFSFAPLKITEKQEKILIGLCEENPPDPNGIINV